MPKRNNPFGDHSSLQLKTHVGEKEVDKGVCQQTRMQAVYEKTQELLFSGMRQQHELEMKGMGIDTNDNVMSWNDENERASAENLAFKQLHLNKNCELVSTVEDGSTDMDTDSNSCQHALPQMPMTLFNFVSSSKAADAQKQHNYYGFFPLSSSLGRSSGEYSPPGALSPSSKNSLFEASSSSHSASNAFSHLKQAQLKKDSIKEHNVLRGACHNCRQPVPSRDVMKCQFCDSYVCHVCVRQCRGCFLYFCQLCSVLNYDQSVERAFCLSCSGR